MRDRIRATMGIDVGDRFCRYHVLDQASGEDLDRGTVPTKPDRLYELCGRYRGLRAVMEVGPHSRWASVAGEEAGAEVLVANARKLRFIFANDRKSDSMDAELLARVGRMDPRLLSPIRHRGRDVQRDLAVIRARATVVRSRTQLANAVRGILKSFGVRLRGAQPGWLGPRDLAGVPADLQPAVRPLLSAIELLSEEIAEYDHRIEYLATERYPQADRLTCVYGVGHQTALAFILTLEDPAHYESGRAAGAFLGLVPRRDQSGATEKQLHITKAGDPLVRTLLVQCAHKILGRSAPDSDLRRAGLKIAERGGKSAKCRALIAVARKLAVLLYALWSTGEVYEPLRNSARGV